MLKAIVFSPATCPPNEISQSEIQLRNGHVASESYLYFRITGFSMRRTRLPTIAQARTLQVQYDRFVTCRKHRHRKHFHILKERAAAMIANLILLLRKWIIIDMI